MADIDISTTQTVTVAEDVAKFYDFLFLSVIQSVTVAENVAKLYDFLFATVTQAVTVAENVGKKVGDPQISTTQAVTITENIGTPTFAIKVYKGMNALTVTLLTKDWQVLDARPNFSHTGIPLKGIILVPGSGGPDTFSIKDASDAGAQLYYGAVAAATVLVYPGSMCKPYIDYSECTLSTGHKVTFIW